MWYNDSFIIICRWQWLPSQALAPHPITTLQRKCTLMVLMLSGPSIDPFKCYFDALGGRLLHHPARMCK